MRTVERLMEELGEKSRQVFKVRRLVEGVRQEIELNEISKISEGDIVFVRGQEALYIGRDSGDKTVMNFYSRIGRLDKSIRDFAMFERDIYQNSRGLEYRGITFLKNRIFDKDKTSDAEKYEEINARLKEEGL